MKLARNALSAKAIASVSTDLSKSMKKLSTGGRKAFKIQAPTMKVNWVAQQINSSRVTALIRLAVLEMQMTEIKDDDNDWGKQQLVPILHIELYICMI